MMLGRSVEVLTRRRGLPACVYCVACERLRANSTGQRLSAGVKRLADLDLAYAVQADAVYATICGRQTISLGTSAATVMAREEFVDTLPGELDAGCGRRKDRRQLSRRIAHRHGHRLPPGSVSSNAQAYPGRSERATVAAIDTARCCRPRSRANHPARLKDDPGRSSRAGCRSRGRLGWPG